MLFFGSFILIVGIGCWFFHLNAFFQTYIGVVNKDSANPVRIAMTKKNPGHGKKPEQGRHFPLFCRLKVLYSSDPYILKAGDPGDRTPPIFFIFRQNLGWERENLQDCTALMPLHLFVVFAAWLLHTEPFFKPRNVLPCNVSSWKNFANRGWNVIAILCLVFVFNINTSDLLYFDIMLLKTPDLCNLRTFVAIFFLSRFTHIFRQFLEAKKQTPPIYPLLECMWTRLSDTVTKIIIIISE